MVSPAIDALTKGHPPACPNISDDRERRTCLQSLDRSESAALVSVASGQPEERHRNRRRRFYRIEPRPWTAEEVSRRAVDGDRRFSFRRFQKPRGIQRGFHRRRTSPHWIGKSNSETNASTLFFIWPRSPTRRTTTNLNRFTITSKASAESFALPAQARRA